MRARSEEFAAGSQHLHPYLRDYPSDAPGGIGSVQGSTVGMVPTHVLARYRHHEADVDPESESVVQRVVNDIHAGHGIEEPVIMEYDPRTNWAYLGEGNHRLRAAEKAGLPEVPVRVQRSRNPATVHEIEGRGGPAFHKPEAEMGGGHVPQGFHPDFLEFRESHEARDVHSEIADLLTPTWGRR